jgi:hypothetical protein
MRHLGALVNTRGVTNFFLHYGEDAGRRGLSGAAGADGRSRDAHTVAIDVQMLVRQAHQNHNRPIWGQFRVPRVVAGFKVGSKRCYSSTFGVSLSVAALSGK